MLCHCVSQALSCVKFTHRIVSFALTMAKYKEPSVIYSEYQKLDYPLHMNYGRFVLDRLLKNKGRTALINGATHESVTYGELAQLVVNTAASLTQLGVNVGDVVGICSENRTEFLTTAIAGWAIGAVVTFLNRAYSKDELLHTMNTSKPKLMFMSPTTFKSYSDIIKCMDFVKEIILFGTEISHQDVVSFNKVTSSKVQIDSFKTDQFNGSEQTALILYSSGTTGFPKGAKLSHRNLITSGLRPLPLQLGLVCLSIAPWSNTIGCILTMDELVYNQTVVYLNRFNEEMYFTCIEKYKVGFLLVVPPLLVLLNQSKIIQDYNLHSVQLIYSGGASLGEGVIKQTKKTFPKLKHVLQGYGMTETSGGITEEHEDSPRQCSVGRIIQGNIIKIVDVESRKILGPNQPGEICVKGPVLFQGYIGKDLKEDLDEEGFYKTGDVAYYDEDGYFYIVDRLKELIKYKAGQVSPSELEALLRQHPAVMDVGVIGLPDPLAGELPTALVVKNTGTSVTEKELVDFVAAKVSSWKQLRGGVTFVKEIPKTSSGKILRRKLREMSTKPPSSKL